MSTQHEEVSEALVRLIKNLWDDGLGLSHEGIARDLRRNIGFTLNVDRVREICNAVSPIRIITLSQLDHYDCDGLQFNGCEEEL